MDLYDDPAYEYHPRVASGHAQNPYEHDPLLDDPIEDDFAYMDAGEHIEQYSSSPARRYAGNVQQHSHSSRGSYHQHAPGASYAQPAPMHARHAPISNRLSQPSRVPDSSYSQSQPAPGPSRQIRAGYGVPARYDEPGEPREQTVLGIRLRPVSDLPDAFRGLFKFSVFNAVQSKCFDTLSHSEDNMVVTAPTGSGKTVLFELAIIRMIANDGSKTSKCVYMAPTKALCSERYRDWSTKFEPLGIKCCELTGDTVTYGKGAWGDAYASRVIVTTPEKWDSLTRHWAEHEDILATMKLFLVDEVHILNESRGSTLEVCIARMKLRGNAVRFVLVSATAPNISDIAAWIGRRGSIDEPAEMFTFGEEFRPCQLKRFVYAYPPKPSEFQFQKTLDFKLFSHLQTHSANKPILVFCPTRKGTVQTAEQLMKDYKLAKSGRQALPWHAPHKLQASFQDTQLQTLAEAGIGVHHAGVGYSDRGLTEELYSKKILRVIVATSTLAVGVNLPAHTVVIKGTKLFQGQGWCEYSEADIFQMMGRAGRPQFDKDGIVIIMTSTLDENKYQNIVGGQTNLESFLHHNLAEHINSEVGLGTIANVDSAKTWLQNSFFYQRIQKNPAHYRLDKASTQTWSQRLEEIVVESLNDLKGAGLVAKEAEESDKLVATEFGDIMSKYYIRLSTMKLFLDIPMNTSLKAILEVVCTAEELSDARLRFGEKQIYNKLREHNDIRFKTNKVEKTSDKVFVLIQAILGGISLSDKEYELGGQAHLDAIPILKHCPRFARAIADIGIAKQSGSLTKFGLELLRCFHAKAWEGRPVVLRQIEHLGDKSIKVLSQHGITSFSKLREQDQIRIEALLNRRPPFGLDVLAAAKELPDFDIKIVDSSIETHGGREEVDCTLTVECSATVELSKHKRRKQKQALGLTSVLTVTSDEQFIDFRNISTRALVREAKTFTIKAKLSKPSQYIEVSISADNFAGVLRVVTWKPNVRAHEFPVPDTRPKSAIDMEVEMCMKDPEFWMAFEEPMRTDSDEMDKPQVSTSKILQALDKVQMSASKGPTPAKRPDGKYDCNHTCKDKTCCRHLCCRDGLDRPPKVTKAATKPRPKSTNSQADAVSDAGRRLTLQNNRGPPPSPSLSAKLESDDARSLSVLQRYAPSSPRAPGPRSPVAGFSGGKRKLSSWDENTAAPSSDAPSALDFFEPDDPPPPPKKRKTAKRPANKPVGSLSSVSSQLPMVLTPSPRKPALPQRTKVPLFLPDSDSDDLLSRLPSDPPFAAPHDDIPAPFDNDSSTPLELPAETKADWLDDFDDYLMQTNDLRFSHTQSHSTPPSLVSPRRTAVETVSLATPPTVAKVQADDAQSEADLVANSINEDLAMFEEWLQSGNVIIED